MSCLFLHTADTLSEEVKLRNDSILNNLVLAPWRVVSFELWPHWRNTTGQMVLLSVPVSAQPNFPGRRLSCVCRPNNRIDPLTHILRQVPLQIDPYMLSGWWSRMRNWIQKQEERWEFLLETNCPNVYSLTVRSERGLFPSQSTWKRRFSLPRLPNCLWLPAWLAPGLTHHSGRICPRLTASSRTWGNYKAKVYV